MGILYYQHGIFRCSVGGRTVNMRSLVMIWVDDTVNTRSFVTVQVDCDVNIYDLSLRYGWGLIKAYLHSFKSWGALSLTGESSVSGQENEMLNAGDVCYELGRRRGQYPHTPSPLSLALVMA